MRPRKSLSTSLAARQLMLVNMLVLAAAVPSPQSNFHYQLGQLIKSMPNDLQPAKFNIVAYGIDGFDTSAKVVKEMKDRGLYPICYFSAGSSEEWRSDFNRFPQEALGKKMEGWVGEKWLDIRNAQIREIMVDRMKMCKEKGFPAVDPDNVDTHTQDSGFPITAQDNVDFLTFLSTEAHALGLEIGLKNNLGQIPQLVSMFDFAVNEQCWEYNECDEYAPFVSASKPVWNVNYYIKPKAFNKICPKAAKLGIKSTLQKLKLDKWRKQCPE